MQVMLPMQEQCCPHSHVATHHQTIFKPLAENCFPIEPLSLKTISGGMNTETKYSKRSRFEELPPESNALCSGWSRQVAELQSTLQQKMVLAAN